MSAPAAAEVSGTECHEAGAGPAPPTLPLEVRLSNNDTGTGTNYSNIKFVFVSCNRKMVLCKKILYLVYRTAGPNGWSEPETQSVRDFIMKRKGEWIFFDSLHAYSQYILLPWGYTDEKLEDYENLKTLYV